METNAERRRRKLEWLCGKKGIYEVAKGAGMNWQSLDQVIKRSLLPPKKDGTRSIKNLGEAAARKIEKSENLGVGWFDQIDADVHEHVTSTTTQDASVIRGPGSNVFDIQDSRSKVRDDELVIPQFNTGGSMGSGLILRDQPGQIKGWTVNREWLMKNIKNHTGAANLCIVTGFGDSMKGMYNSGDPLLVDTGVKSVEYDAVFFFRVGDEGFIKRLQRVPGEGLVALSENKAYKDWVIQKEMDFEVFGRVLKVWQSEDF